MNVIDKLAPIKERQAKQNSQEWFDGKLLMKSKIVTNHLKIFKKSKLHIGKDINYVARYKSQKIIINKKERFLKVN